MKLSKENIITIFCSSVLTLGLISFLGFTSNKEQNGFLVHDEVPVGSIMAWAGDPAYLPDNWKVCDGLTMAKNQYPELYRVVAENWTPDKGVNQDLFKIPDLRGVFLRGVSGTRNDPYKDPEKDIRTAFGNSPSNAVGSFQSQSTKLPSKAFTGGTAAAGRHTHNLPGQGGFRGVEHGANDTKNKVTFGDHVHPATNITLSANDHTHTLTINGGGDVETRPGNAYIHWIIKVR
jgi:hypothetical protein